MTGTWRVSANGSCQAAYFKSAERTKTKRNEEALAGTVTSQGMTVSGQLILAGAREGQFINPTTDKAIFLLDTLPNNQLGFTPIGDEFDEAGILTRPFDGDGIRVTVTTAADSARVIAAARTALGS